MYSEGYTVNDYRIIIGYWAILLRVLYKGFMLTFKPYIHFQVGQVELLNLVVKQIFTHPNVDTFDLMTNE